MCKKHTPSFSVGILAGGKSTRMGQNKALMELNNETMIARISKQFKRCPEVLIYAAERGVYEHLGLRVVYDEADSIGPIEGIHRLLSEAKEQYVFICAADMPFVNLEIAEYLAEFICSDYDAYVVVDEEHVHPLLAMYSKRVLPVIEDLIQRGKYRLMEILRAVRTKYVSLEHTNIDPRVVKNVNTKDEFLRLSLPVVFCVSGYHNSGKTGLIEKLINEFIRADFTVGVLKHDGQDHVKRVDGTDTDRYHRAGAACSILTSDSSFVLDAKGAADAELLLRMMQSLPNPPDVCIAEGFKSSKLPKIEVVRRDVEPRSVCDPETLICIVTDCISPEEVSCPVFAREDVQGIFSCLMKYFALW